MSLQEVSSSLRNNIGGRAISGWPARKLDRVVPELSGARSRRRSSRGHLGAEHDVLAQRVEASDQALASAVLADVVEVVGAEVGQGCSTLNS
jgi:hypothetical protein